MTQMTTPVKPRDRVLVALDTPDVAKAAEISRSLAGQVGGIKLGLEFFNANGHDGVRQVVRALPQETPRGDVPFQQRLFLDLKFHDIPNTVAGAVRSVMSLGPSILNVHASGGPAMMKAALDSANFEAEQLGTIRPMLIAVTVLTSLDDADLGSVGVQNSSRDQAVRLAALAQKSGLDGVVCSSREIRAIRAECGHDFKLIVPGIRPTGAAPGDQKRVMTPSEALSEGADFLVIGRPITGAQDPAKAAADLIKEMVL
jgi:orotidine-5'-phosphate decarboxylase